MTASIHARGFFPPRDPDEGDEILARLAPHWEEHLNDSAVLDAVIDAIAFDRVIVPGQCQRPNCRNVAREGKKTCLPCAQLAAEYNRKYVRKHREKAHAATA